MYLSHLKAGDKAFLSPQNPPTAMFLRLIDMGTCSLMPIECLFKSLSGNMKAYRIGNSVIALRCSDCDYIQVFQ